MPLRGRPAPHPVRVAELAQGSFVRLIFAACACLCPLVARHQLLSAGVRHMQSSCLGTLKRESLTEVAGAGRGTFPERFQHTGNDRVHLRPSGFHGPRSGELPEWLRVPTSVEQTLSSGQEFLRDPTVAPFPTQFVEDFAVYRPRAWLRTGSFPFRHGPASRLLGVSRLKQQVCTLLVLHAAVAMCLQLAT